MLRWGLRQRPRATGQRSFLRASLPYVAPQPCLMRIPKGLLAGVNARVLGLPQARFIPRP